MNLFHDTHDSVPVALVAGIAELELRTNRRASGKVAISERFIDGRHLRVRMSVRYLKTNLTVAWALFDHGGHIIKTRQQRLEPLLKGATPPNAVNEVIAVKTNFDVPSGDYMIRLVVRARDTQMMSATNSAVVVCRRARDGAGLS